MTTFAKKSSLNLFKNGKDTIWTRNFSFFENFRQDFKIFKFFLI